MTPVCVLIGRAANQSRTLFCRARNTSKKMIPTPQPAMTSVGMSSHLTSTKSSVNSEFLMVTISGTKGS